MFSKFKVDKPQANVLYKRGPRHFEVEQSVLSLPLLEAYDQRIRHLHEIVSDQATELAERRAEVFQLRQELQFGSPFNWLTDNRPSPSINRNTK